MTALRVALAVLMGLHGVAHLPGFLASWQLGRLEGLPHKTTLLAGHLDLGQAGIRMVGLLWMMTAAAFLYCAFAAATERPFWVGVAAAVSGFSLLLSLISWPEARIGVFINALLLVAFAINARL